MAITQGQVTVTTTAVALATAGVDGSMLTVHNGSATQNLFLGNSAVTGNDGLELHSHTTLQIQMLPGDTLYAISSTGSHLVSWMKQD
jgi:hypothetical protein